MPQFSGLPPIHPGVMLKEFLDDKNETMSQFALRLRVPSNHITDIVRGTRSVTARTALRIARATGTSPEYWMNLQSQFEIQTILKQKEKKDEILRIEPFPD